MEKNTPTPEQQKAWEKYKKTLEKKPYSEIISEFEKKFKECESLKKINAELKQNEPSDAVKASKSKALKENKKLKGIIKTIQNKVAEIDTTDEE